MTKQISLHIITNLSTCYDRQLANIESLVLELVGVNRQIIVLIAKVLPSFKHYIYTSYGICKSNYESETDPYVGTSHGNITSGEVCKIKSCLIIRMIEKQ